MDKNLEISDLGAIKTATGLTYKGIVTAINGTTEVTVASLAGYGDDFFASASYADWEMYHQWDTGGSGAAPQGLLTRVTSYTSVGGVFTIEAFATGTAAVGDVVLLVHPILAWLGTKADAAASGAHGTTTFLSAYIKQLLDELLGTDGGWTNLAGSATDSLDEAIQALAKVLAIDGANVLSISVDGTARTTYETILENIAIILGARADTIPAMNAAPDSDAIIPLVKAILERIGVTPADPDDSLHTIIGQRDTAAEVGATGGTEALVGLIRQIVTNTYLLAEAADGGGVFPASVADDSLFAKILDSGNPAKGTDYDNTTMSLRAIRAAIDALVAIAATDKGVLQTLEVAVTANADAGADTLLATVANGSVIITEIVVFAVAAQTGDMLSAPVKGGAAKVITFLAAADIAQADVDAADKQVYWSGKVRLNTDDTILMEHNGTGVTALNLVVAITFYASSADGATMS